MYKKNTIIIFIIWILSTYTLSAKYWDNVINDGANYFTYMITILKWFSVWATLIAFLWSTLNLIFIKEKITKYQPWIKNYNFKIFTIAYNVMAGIIYWSGLFTYKFQELVPNPIINPLAFSYSLMGHTIIPILLMLYLIISREKINNKLFYQKDIFYSLIYPSLYALVATIRSLILYIYWSNYYKNNSTLNHLFAYWFLNWITYGWTILFAGIIVSAIITLTTVTLLNIINNIIWKKQIKNKNII